MTTHITMVIDRSGSMSAIQSEAEGAINAFVAEQQKVDEPATLLVLDFDDSNSANVVYDGDLAAFKKYKLEPRGMTPLLDAVGQSIVKTKNRAKGADKVFVVITTDGHENASREFTKDQVVSQITKREKKGWTFIFQAAGADAWSAANAFAGTQMHNTNTVRSGATGQAMGSTYAFTSANVTAARQGLNVSYAAEVDDDGKVRTPA